MENVRVFSIPRTKYHLWMFEREYLLPFRTSRSFWQSWGVIKGRSRVKNVCGEEIRVIQYTTYMTFTLSSIDFSEHLDPPLAMICAINKVQFTFPNTTRRCQEVLKELNCYAYK